MANLMLTLQVTPGARIEAVAREMVEIATHIGVLVECEFNDIRLCSGRGLTALDIVQWYHRESEQRRKTKGESQ